MSSLDSLIRANPEIAPAADILRLLATTLPDITLPANLPHLAASEVRVASGVPALEGELLINGATLLANVRVLAAALGERTETTHGLMDALDQHLTVEEADSLAAASLAGAWNVIALTARVAGLDEDLVTTLFDHAARPALRAGAQIVRQLTDQCHWNRAMCPCCGAPPLLAELRSGSSSPAGAEQERVLRCGRCSSAWSFPRLRCVGCGETRHQQLAYLHGPGEGVFRRADTCSTCGTYIKSVAVLAPLTVLELLELDFATAALDVAAVEHGLHR